jgi:PPM family protein phosphatase
VTITTSLIVQPGNPECRGRAEVISCGERTVLILAGGAGGISGGAQAAELCVRLLRAAADRIKTTEDCVALLTRVDEELARRKECGETTGVIVVIDSSRIFGASVGDSAAWLFASDGNGELTRGQQRKPLLGSGGALPRSFNWDTEDGTIVVASDGLWNYTTVDAIRSRVQTRDSTDLALRLAELARLPSGTFPDDVAVITCRIDAPPC